MDLNGIAKAYQLVYEKKKLDPVGKEDEDIDNDGDVDSSDKYLKKRRAAIGDAMGKDGDKEEEEEKKSKKKKGHDCASKVKHEEYGVGDCIKEMHTLDSAGNVTHYDVMFEHGMEKNVFVGDLSVLVSEMHEHVINTDKNKEVLGNKDLMSAYYSMYEHHQKDADGNVIPHEDEEEVKESIDLSFVDELTEQELDNLVEGVVYDLLDEGVELDAIEGAFTEYLEEAKVTMGHDSYGPQTASRKEKKDVKIKQKKEKAEARAKASVERAEKFKKSVGKAVTGMKAKMHGGMADYAGKRKLIPTASAEKAASGKTTKTKAQKKAAALPKGKVSEKDLVTQRKGKEAAQKDMTKAMSKRRTAGVIKKTLTGPKAKEERQKLRSTVFKDVKDRVGKKAKAVMGAPKKASERVQNFVKKGKQKIGRSLIGLGQKMAEQGGELDMFDTVTAYLIDEGLVKDFDHAQRVMSTLDSTLIEEVHAQQLEYLKEYGGSTDKPMLIVKADKTGNTKAYQNYKAGMKSKVTGKPMYQAADHMKNESLEDAYLKVYEEKSTGDKLKDIAKKKQEKYDAQPQAYKNNPAFGDESHHSNAKNK